MAGLLYFVPGATWLVPEAANLAAAGLGEVLGGLPVDAQPCTGPEGAGQLIWASSDPLELRGYQPDRQTWRRCAVPVSPCPRVPVSPRPWVGFWRDARPGPEDLARPAPVPGHPVELADRRRWSVPIGRRCTGDCGLPSTYVLEAGALGQEVTPEYAALWADVLKLWTRVPLSDLQLAAIAYRALAVNYRLGPDEINLLGLVGPHNVVAILGALLDHPTIAALDAEIAASKKAGAGEASPGTPAGASSASGAPAPSPATPPASPTSAG